LKTANKRNRQVVIYWDNQKFRSFWNYFRYHMDICNLSHY